MFKPQINQLVVKLDMRYIYCNNWKLGKNIFWLSIYSNRKNAQSWKSYTKMIRNFIENL